ncbi:SigE family RNA polymerase sigma factor [Kitasatospora viridis]|uniref:SigE family RNA polymerase sigma factor n=1 Tax=Kitasatospora viridis TaxID=281105 RepID=UPI001FE8DB7F|nr:SigE family RNA polymerase sigma factor [Kitasatospora viridis]
MIGLRRGRETAAERIDFTEFVQQRSAALFRTAYLLTGSRETAEDLVQEALEKAYRRWSRICAADSPEAYLRRMVVNLANDRWRHQRHDGGEAAGTAEDRAADDDPFALVDLREELVQALHALPIGMRTAVVLHYLHDMDDQQIAEMLNVSPSTVRSQLSRALVKLRAARRPAGPSQGGRAVARPLTLLDLKGV